jgi:hypothetical protein
MENVTEYNLILDRYDTQIQMFEGDEIVRIVENGKTIAEYRYAGAGCTDITQLDAKKLIDLLAVIMYDKGKQK